MAEPSMLGMGLGPWRLEKEVNNQTRAIEGVIKHLKKIGDRLDNIEKGFIKFEKSLSACINRLKEPEEDQNGHL